MPSNPFSNLQKNDPLAPSGGTGAWGNASAGFGSNANAYATTNDEYDVVEIEEPSAKAKTTVTKGSNAATGDARRERDLARKEAELQKREADLQRREAAVRAAVDPMSVKNFPPCMPFLHHDIANDIPDGKRSITRQGMFLYFATVIALVYNFVCVLVAWGDTGDTYFISSFFFALIYMITGVPLAWFLWYMPLYRAMMKDGALSFFGFFCTFIIHILFCIYSAVAPTFDTGTGGSKAYASAGLLAALSLNSHGYTLSFIFYIAGFAWWAALATLSFFYMFAVYATFRNAGGVTAARREATVAGVQMAQADLAAQNGGRR